MLADGGEFTRALVSNSTPAFGMSQARGDSRWSP
jgi:hypothetical protein